MKPSDTLPLDVRDELYRLFKAGVGREKAAAEFAAGVAKLERVCGGSWVKAAYLDDRKPRFERALAATAGLKEPLRVSRALFNEGLFFDAHEFLEGDWKDASGRAKTVIQGFIQAAAGLHKLELGSEAGCAHLLGLAAEKLAQAKGASLRALGEAIKESQRRLLAGAFTPDDAPKLDDADLAV